MTDVLGWALGLTLVLVFVIGVAPGSVLRILVRLYPKDDPRRRELLAELYAIRPVARSAWVAEQMEIAFLEGLARRVAHIKARYRKRRPIGFTFRARFWKWLFNASARDTEDEFAARIEYELKRVSQSEREID